MNLTFSKKLIRVLFFSFLLNQMSTYSYAGGCLGKEQKNSVDVEEPKRTSWKKPTEDAPRGMSLKDSHQPPKSNRKPISLDELCTSDETIAENSSSFFKNATTSYDSNPEKSSFIKNVTSNDEPKSPVTSSEVAPKQPPSNENVAEDSSLDLEYLVEVHVQKTDPEKHSLPSKTLGTLFESNLENLFQFTTTLPTLKVSKGNILDQILNTRSTSDEDEDEKNDEKFSACLENLSDSPQPETSDELSNEILSQILDSQMTSDDFAGEEFTIFIKNLSTSGEITD